ncbi:protein D2-like [Dendronephthya gigantea]|uniref:protein D2-like n=1 Tax=Dendronephthya gigantea TaxID=151771 RepID=UPI00106C20F4|nr:protein D2-like [Dendronephthya gigantea]
MNSPRGDVVVLFLCIFSICETQSYDFNACPSSRNDFLEVVYGPLAVKCNTKYKRDLVISVPRITFSHADQQKFYEVIMIDPDAPSATDPKCRSWLHLMLSDVKGSDLKNGISPNGITGLNVITAYNPPTPPKGRGYHRYILAAFGHARPLNNKKKITERCGFDIDAFTNAHNLNTVPDASNMFQTITE